MYTRRRPAAAGPMGSTTSAVGGSPGSRKSKKGKRGGGPGKKAVPVSNPIEALLNAADGSKVLGLIAAAKPASSGGAPNRDLVSFEDQFKIVEAAHKEIETHASSVAAALKTAEAERAKAAAAAVGSSEKTAAEVDMQAAVKAAEQAQTDLDTKVSELKSAQAAAVKAAEALELSLSASSSTTPGRGRASSSASTASAASSVSAAPSASAYHLVSVLESYKTEAESKKAKAAADIAAFSTPPGASAAAGVGSAAGAAAGSAATVVFDGASVSALESHLSNREYLIQTERATGNKVDRVVLHAFDSSTGKGEIALYQGQGSGIVTRKMADVTLHPDNKYEVSIVPHAKLDDQVRVLREGIASTGSADLEIKNLNKEVVKPLTRALKQEIETVGRSPPFKITALPELPASGTPTDEEKKAAKAGDDLLVALYAEFKGGDAKRAQLASALSPNLVNRLNTLLGPTGEKPLRVAASATFEAGAGAGAGSGSGTGSVVTPPVAPSGSWLNRLKFWAPKAPTAQAAPVSPAAVPAVPAVPAATAAPVAASVVAAPHTQQAGAAVAGSGSVAASATPSANSSSGAAISRPLGSGPFAGAATAAAPVSGHDSSAPSDGK